MRREAVTQSPRLAGSVMRYHTWPTLQQQTVADHSFHVLRIYSALFGPPEPEVTEYIIQHDLGEVTTGDLPFPIKARNPVLKDYLDDLEERSLEEMGFPEAPNVNQGQRRRIKICDLLEMHEFGRVEVTMGNSICVPVMEDTFSSALELAEGNEVDKIVDYLSTSVGGLRNG